MKRSCFSCSLTLVTAMYTLLLAVSPQAWAGSQEGEPTPFLPEARLSSTASVPSAPETFRVELCPTIGLEVMSSADWDGESVIKAGGDIRLLWMMKPGGLGMGLRVAASSAISDDLHYTTMDTGFVLKVHWFWFSTGMAVLVGEELAMPLLSLALGLDVPLGRHLALRLQASGHNMILFNQGFLGGGLVAHF